MFLNDVSLAGRIMEIGKIVTESTGFGGHTEWIPFSLYVEEVRVRMPSEPLLISCQAFHEHALIIRDVMRTNYAIYCQGRIRTYADKRAFLHGTPRDVLFVVHTMRPLLLTAGARPGERRFGPDGAARQTDAAMEEYWAMTKRLQQRAIKRESTQKDYPHVWPEGGVERVMPRMPDYSRRGRARSARKAKAADGGAAGTDIVGAG